jgi:hypothetical protein
VSVDHNDLIAKIKGGKTGFDAIGLIMGDDAGAKLGRVHAEDLSYWREVVDGAMRLSTPCSSNLATNWSSCSFRLMAACGGSARRAVG